VRPEGDGLLFCWYTGRRTNAIDHRVPDSLTVTQLRFEEKAGPLTADRALTFTIGAAGPIIYFFQPFQCFAFCLPIARNSAWTRDVWHRDPPSNGFPSCLPLTGQHGKPNGISMSSVFCSRHSGKDVHQVQQRPRGHSSRPYGAGISKVMPAFAGPGSSAHRWRASVDRQGRPSPPAFPRWERSRPHPGAAAPRSCRPREYWA